MNMKIWLKIDVTTDDVITPGAVRYTMKTMFDERPITIWAYNLETVIAEKFETIIRRGVTNTRPRDFYDVHMLLKLQSKNINLPMLLRAINATAKQRGSTKLLSNRDVVYGELLNSPVMRQRWANYSREYPYVSDASYEEVLNAVKYINDTISQQKTKSRTRPQDLSR